MSIVGTLPYVLTNGTTADASQVEADLQYIADQVNTNGLPLAGGTMTGPLVVTDISGATAEFSGNVKANGVVLPIGTSGTFTNVTNATWALPASLVHCNITVTSIIPVGGGTSGHFDLQFSYDSGATWLAGTAYDWTESFGGAPVSMTLQPSIRIINSFTIGSPWVRNLILDLYPFSGDVSAFYRSCATYNNGGTQAFQQSYGSGVVTGAHGLPTNVRLMQDAGNMSGAWTQVVMQY